MLCLYAGNNQKPAHKKKRGIKISLYPRSNKQLYIAMGHIKHGGETFFGKMAAVNISSVA